MLVSWYSKLRHRYTREYDLTRVVDLWKASQHIFAGETTERLIRMRSR